MTLRAKTKKRLMILVVIAAAGTLGLGGLWGYRLNARKHAYALARQEGLNAMAQGNYERVLDRLAFCYNRYSNDPAVVSALAEANYKLDDPEGGHLRSAMNLYRTWLNLEPGNEDAQHKLLELYQKVVYRSEALGLADKILQRHPTDAKALQARAFALWGLHRFDDAWTTFKKLNELQPLDVENQIGTLQLMRERGRPSEEILKHAADLRTKYPNDYRMEYISSIACTLTGDSAGALTWVRAAAARPITEPVMLHGISNLLDRLGQYLEATALLDKNTARKTDLNLQRVWALRLWELGRHAQVEREFADLDPATGDPELLALRCLALLKLEQRPAALKIVETLSTRTATNREARLWTPILRGLLAPQIDWVQVRHDLRTAQLTWQQHPIIHYILGEAALQTSDADTASKEWQLTAFQLAPGWALPVVSLSRLVATEGEFGMAYRLAEDAHRRAPEDADVRLNLVQTWAAALDAGKAQGLDELLDLIAQIQKTDPRAQSTIPVQVRLLLKNNRRAEGLKTFHAALDATPALSEGVFLRLAAVSRESELGLEQECFDRSLKAHGVTPTLVLTRALWLHNCKQTEEARTYFTTQRAAAKTVDADWDIASTEFLDQIADPAAKQQWDDLSRKNPDNLQIQWRVLNSRAAAPDHALLGQALQRLRTKLGDDNNQMKFLQARWLMQGTGDDKTRKEAITLLTDVIRAQPTNLAARMLLGTIHQQQDNIAGAIEQWRAAADLQRENPNLALTASQLLLRQGDVSLARDYLNRALTLKIKDPTLLRRAASLQAQLGEYQQALDLLKQIPDEGGGKTPSLPLAVLYRQDGLLDESEAICLKLMEKPDATIIQFTADLLAYRGKLDQARKVLDQLDGLTLRPGFKELVRGEFERVYGKPDQALAYFRTATKLAPTEVPGWRQLAYTYLLQNQPREAAAVLRQAAAALPGNPQFQSLAQQADLLQDLGAQVPTQALVAALFQAPAEHQQPIIETLQLLQKARTDSDTFNTVLPKLRQMVERNPRVLPLLVLLTQFDLTAGQVDDAIAVSTRGMQSFPTAAEPARLATVALSTAGRWDEMLSAAQEWRRRSLPERLQADLAIAKAQLQRGHPEEGLQQLQPYLKQAHAQPEAMAPIILLELEILLAQGQHAPAAALIEPQLARSAPWRAVWRDSALHKIRNPKITAAWLEKLGTATPPDAFEEQVLLARSWRALGAACGVSNYQTRGIKITDDLAAKPGATAVVFLDLGILRQQQGDLAAAEAAFRKCLTLEPHQATAQNNLASLLILRPGADLKEAQTLMADALKSNPGSASYYDTQAAVFAQLKQVDQAVASLNQAVRLEPGNLDWQFNLATILLETGRRDKAGVVLEQIESLHLSPPRLTPTWHQKLESLRTALGRKPQ